MRWELINHIAVSIAAKLFRKLEPRFQIKTSKIMSLDIL